MAFKILMIIQALRDVSDGRLRCVRDYELACQKGIQMRGFGARGMLREDTHRRVSCGKEPACRQFQPS